MTSRTVPRQAAACSILYALLLGVALSLVPGRAIADSCGGSCTLELATNPKGLQKYAKKATAALTKCLKSGKPACPTPCPLPEPIRFGLSNTCGSLLQCKLADLLDATVAGIGWNGEGRCATASADGCAKYRFKQVRKLVVKVLSSIRKRKIAKAARFETKCGKQINARRACATRGDGTALCTAAATIPYSLMETLFPICDGVSQDEVAAAMDRAITRLGAKGIRISETWGDADTLFALITQTFLELNCLGRAQTLLPPAAIDAAAPAESATRYCGPGSCAADSFSCWLPDPGDCLNDVCSAHDDCYGVVERDECITLSCTWSSQTAPCDFAFLLDSAHCGIDGECGFVCRAVLAAAASLTATNLAREREGDPCPRSPGACPSCPGRCKSDCTCAATTTTTTTSTTTTLPACGFDCGDGNCISAETVCNGISDCAGGQDEDPGLCGVAENCCVATRGCPSETGTSCADTCCCCPIDQACCANWALGCCASP